ncbi:MAG: transposase [Candidatus Eisenbacteria bacterium]|nr:transposase [Candidatus Eisenbacteria bacterium]
MFKKNHRHLQIPLTSHVDELPEKLRKRLENSWAGTFYREFFCRLDEKPFEVLYADFPSRPNVPVNVLVGLEFLKAANGWTDEEMYDMFCYDIQVRYALGYRQLGEGDFELRTLYYFRERLSRHSQETGVNLLDKAFEQVTDTQIAAFHLKTGKQRMDSTQLASSIRQMGRVQLLVEVLQRVHRMLSEADQARYAELFAPYIKGHAGQYVYHMKGEEVGAHLQRIGEVMQRLLADLKAGYASEAVYQVLERVFGEHFQVKERKVTVKPAKELSASSLQSPDDLEATYREKRGKGYQGYVANLSETCDSENPLQLITKVQVAPNTTDDSQLLAEALPDLKARTELETIYTDGGHGGPQADVVLQEQQVEHTQTAIRGRDPNPEKLHLDDFTLQSNENGKPVEVTCPQGQTVSVQTTSQQKAFVAHFEPSVCQTCPLVERCPARAGKRDERHHLRFTQSEAQMAKRRRRSREHLQEGRNLRAAVEATVRSVKHPFPAGKLPVRGRFRVACLVIGSAAVANLRRIHRYLQAKMGAEEQQKKASEGRESAREGAGLSVFSFAKAILAAFLGRMQPQELAIGW